MNLSLQIQDRLGQRFQLATIEEVKKFLEAEKRFWLEQKNDIGQNLIGSFISFPQQVDNFFSHLQTYEQGLSTDSQSNNIQQLQQTFESIKSQFIEWLRMYWIYRGSSCTEALLNAYRYSTEAGNAFWEAITSKQVVLNQNRVSLSAFVGNVMVYEHLLQDQSHLVKRRNAEKKAFSTLRNDLEDERNRQVSDFEIFRESYLTWHTNSTTEFNDWLNKCKKHSDDRITEHSDDFKLKIEEATKRHQELEDLYTEKLRLEKPAKYWDDRAKNLKKQGVIWIVFLLGALACGIAYFTYLFTHWLNGQEMTVSLHSLQGTVLLAVIISAFVFLIRLFSRLAFSAFHLQRDAEERQQLAYVYLALMNEKQTDEESRKIILQALFSRAETGLLAAESGPTMPGVDGLAGLITKTAKN